MGKLLWGGQIDNPDDKQPTGTKSKRSNQIVWLISIAKN